MATKDAKRLNPGIQVANLFPGAGTKAGQQLERQTSEPKFYAVVSAQMPVSGANPTYAFALNDSGSYVTLVPA
jgi:hypothetical protein